MDVAVIDWKSIDSRFVKDEMYELINAPKWVDFSAPDDPLVNDDTWFCRPNCNHPRRVEDFFKDGERHSKQQRYSASVSEILLPLGDQKRDATLKKRVANRPSVSLMDANYEDGENQNPNFPKTPTNHKSKLRKEAIKSSTERILPRNDDVSQNRRLKSSLSARNLFSGGDLLSKVAEFCSELKKLATHVRDAQVENKSKSHSEINLVAENQETEKKPLLENQETEKTKAKILMEKQRKIKRNDVPIPVDVKNMNPQQIRTSPPTPQGFSASRGATKAAAATPKLVLKSKPAERGILKELKQSDKELVKMVENEEKMDREGRSFNASAFWFLKPCTLSS